MQLSPIEQFFASQQEPVKSCLLFLRSYLLKSDKRITEAWKYRMPFYCYQGSMFCYLWVHKKSKLPYIGFVNGVDLKHPQLVQEKRVRMKILLLDPTKDLDVKTIKALLLQAKEVHKAKA